MAGEPTITFTVEDPHGPVARAITLAMYIEICQIYDEPVDETKTDWTPKRVDGPGGRFIVAWVDGVPSGCGAIRPLEPGIAEVKRVYVAPEQRGRGLARRIMTRLEEEARDLGYQALRLETGTPQPAAIHLYEQMGYRRIPCYPPLEDDPLSVFFEKQLGA